VGTVVDTVKDETSRAFVNGKKSLFIAVYRQNGSNTIAVVERALKAVENVNKQLATAEGKPSLAGVRDATKVIRANVEDVEESIYLGILFAVIVVYFFLGNGRSTFITGLALPNSLIGAFILMYAAGFTINIMTLLALSLCVGLLIDDAIVVRENIFRHIEMGKKPLQAALDGTKEVQLAVIATTFTILAVFGPVAFLKGVVGQFFREFGLTVCFAMLISLFDALTIAPMLSAYFAGDPHKKPKQGIWWHTMGRAVRGFSKFQDWLEDVYEKALHWIVKAPLTTLAVSLLITAACLYTITWVPTTFLPTADAGEYSISFDLPPGASLDETNKVANEIDVLLRKNKEIKTVAMILGGQNAQSNTATYFVTMVPSKERPGVTTTMMKTR
ncbi:MAG: efflux RND transporter permease subunit, partial [Proteobacteria bacterium]